MFQKLFDTDFMIRYDDMECFELSYDQITNALYMNYIDLPWYTCILKAERSG